MSRSISPYERYGGLSPESDAYLEEYVFKAADTLTGLAHRFYDDWRLWRLIADRNNIIDVRQIPAGTILLIPNRPRDEGRFGSV
jgi:nucleoid-associated protein YgaU